MDEFQESVFENAWMVIPFAEVANKAREEVGGWIGWR